MTDPAVVVSLSRDHALILFEFLAQLEDHGCEQQWGAAELRVIWDLQADLERELVEPFASDYPNLLARARHRVAGDGRTDR